MAIIKCKMCGGDLNLIEGASTAECEFCGSVQTIPNLDDEKKLIQFERAERLRKQCEFDKAAGIYETIVADFRQEAEAYWGLVLCKYGIEYVDDPATGKKIPTCHRSSFDSIMEDSDFEQALENADGKARRVYREEAKSIEEIRKGIIAVSSNEQPYDIFICYKETDENGDRTLDSVLAQDIYEALTDKGYRTFFARITLEDKLGLEYEPYIFAALNSAKIMLAVGTDYEHYNAVWVKNEWSRYLKLMAKDKNKHLIPCYKGIDAYDMPKEFARLQAQDLGKVGAMQDLLRGIEKILPKQKNTTVMQEKVVVGGNGNNKIASLLDRGNMALEDGDWAKANSFFEDVLNNDSKNAQAYLGKTLAQERCRTIDAFVRKRKDAFQNVHGEELELQANRAHVDEIVERFSLPRYVEQNAIRKLYEFDLSYHSDVAERKQQYRNEENYWTNHKQLSRAEKFAAGAVAQNLTREKQALFAVLADRVKKAENAEAVAKTDVQARYEAHLRLADEQAEKLYNEGLTRREKYYQELLKIAKTSSDVTELMDIAKKFDQLGDYQESRNLAEHCCKRAAEEQAKTDAEKERQQIAAEQARKAKQKENKIVAIISAIAVCAAVAFIVVLNTVIIPNNKYNDAVALMDAGKYEEAISVFEAMDGYKDSAEKLQAAERARQADIDRQIEAERAAAYAHAQQLMESGYYDEAIAAFEELGTYRDSPAKIKEAKLAIQYTHADRLLFTGSYEEALHAFEALGTFWDSSAKAETAADAIYGMAENYLRASNRAMAAFTFGKIMEYRDAREQCFSLWDQIAVRDTLDVGSTQIIGLREDGTVSMIGSNKTGRYDTSTWKDIIAVSAGLFHYVGLKADGTVVVTGDHSYHAKDWKDIVAIGAGWEHTVGLKSDGTVVADGYNKEGQCNVENWQNIVAISVGMYHTVGLKSDGTVVATGENEHGQCNIWDWSDIVAVSAGIDHTIGLRSDGTLLVVGNNEFGESDVGCWEDIVAISAGWYHSVGLKADGTVIATDWHYSKRYSGMLYEHQCDVDDWRNIVAIAACGENTVGLRSDGTVVAVGEENWDECNIEELLGIKVP